MSLYSDTQELTNDAGVFWPAQQVYDALNEAMVDVWNDLEIHTGTATFTTTIAEEFRALPATIMSPKSISIGGVEWFSTTRVLAERWDHKWKTVSLGLPKHWIVYDHQTLMPFPRPDAMYIVKVEGVLWPTEEITALNLDITEDAKIKRAVMWQAAATLAEHTRPDLVAVWSQEAMEAYKLVAKSLDRNFFGKHIRRVRPGNYISVAHAGDIGFGRTLGTET